MVLPGVIRRRLQPQNQNVIFPAHTHYFPLWHRIRQKAGLDHLRLHDLRHQYASFLVNSRRTLYEVQHILGHSDPKVTMRYAHLSTKALQEAANSASARIEEAMRRKAE
jgi:integrase